jgi:hypothetical protein
VKHNFKRALYLMTARDFTIRAVRAWRRLLPDWTPTLDVFRELDTRPHEHVTAVRIVAEGWEPNDARWDVLAALLEWERREARREVRQEFWAQEGAVQQAVQQWANDVVAPVPEPEPEPQPVIIPVKVTTSQGQVLSESETTVETPLKAAFLSNVQTVKHLRERMSSAGQEHPAPDVPAAREPHHEP